MRLRFWGTRGSLPKPGPTTMRYGGNTPCVEIRTADEQLVVLDCGTGAQGLGQALLTSGVSPVQGHLLLTHLRNAHQKLARCIATHRRAMHLPSR